MELQQLEDVDGTAGGSTPPRLVLWEPVGWTEDYTPQEAEHLAGLLLQARALLSAVMETLARRRTTAERVLALLAEQQADGQGLTRAEVARGWACRSARSTEPSSRWWSAARSGR